MDILPLPAIDSDLCTGCRQCVEACPTNALAQRAGKAQLAFPQRCTYCADCEALCPEGAIGLPYLVVLRAR